MFRLSALATIAAVVTIAVFGTPDGDAAAPGAYRTAPADFQITALAGRACAFPADTVMSGSAQGRIVTMPATDDRAVPEQRPPDTCLVDAGGGSIRIRTGARVPNSLP
jgi:hypothetical protein